MARGRRATVPVIALDAGTGHQEPRCLEPIGFPGSTESYERLATEEIGADGARNPIFHEQYFAAFGRRSRGCGPSAG